MRRLDHHKFSDLNALIDIYAADDPGPGGACHVYQIHAAAAEHDLQIVFQKGALKEVGHNGYSDEALLAIVIDRLRGFQDGPFACRENALALTKLEEAMHWLNARTRDRMQRGVEGQNKP